MKNDKLYTRIMDIIFEETKEFNAKQKHTIETVFIYSIGLLDYLQDIRKNQESIVKEIVDDLK